MNMSLSKINKSVVTVRRGHFMNSVFVNPGIYSCAVDAFLEISTHLFLPYLSNVRTRNGFTDLLFNVCSHYMSSREDSSLLREIREPVWSYIINLCSSFAARDCNACFSQIFEKRTFGYLNEEEENLFMTQRTFDSFCRSCSSSVTLNSSILLTVVTAYGLNQLGLDNNMWPIFVKNTNPGRLNCTNCDTQTSEPVLRNVLNSNRAMLLKNCYIEMNINFHLEKQDQHFSVTAFPKIVENFLQEDIFQYKDNIDNLTEKLLLLENVDFELSQNNKLVISMKAHTSTSQEK